MVRVPDHAVVHCSCRNHRGSLCVPPTPYQRRTGGVREGGGLRTRAEAAGEVNVCVGVWYERAMANLLPSPQTSV